MRTKDELLTAMINLYGFEHEAVIQFARLCDDERISAEQLEPIVIAHEERPLYMDEE